MKSNCLQRWLNLSIQYDRNKTFVIVGYDLNAIPSFINWIKQLAKEVDLYSKETITSLIGLSNLINSSTSWKKIRFLNKDLISSLRVSGCFSKSFNDIKK